MARLSLIFVLFAAALPSFGEAVTASCGITFIPDLPPYLQAIARQGGVQSTGSTSAHCGIGTSPSDIYYPFVQATDSVTLNLSQPYAGFNSFQTTQSMIADTSPATPSTPNGAPTEATTLINFSAVLTTAGPSRIGLLEIVAIGQGSYSSDAGYRNGLTVGILNPDSGPFAAKTQFGCSPNNAGPSCFPPRPDYIVPFQLGTPFLLQAYGGLSVGTYEGIGGAAELFTNYQFRFFEADEITQVAVSEIPEPSVAGLLAGGLGLLALLQITNLTSQRSKQQLSILKQVLYQL